MMKVRVLFPVGIAPYLDGDPEAGAIVELPDALAQSLMNDGWLELVASGKKPRRGKRVEQATAAPGEKRVGRRKTEAAAAAPGEKRGK